MGNLIPVEIRNIFNDMLIIVDFGRELFGFLLKILQMLLQPENVEKLLGIAKKLIEFMFKLFTEFLDKILSLLDLFINNIDKFIELLGDVFNFINVLFDNFVEFLEILPRFVLNIMEFGLSWIDAMNYIMFFIPAILIFYSSVTIVNVLEEKKKEV